MACRKFNPKNRYEWGKKQVAVVPHGREFLGGGIFFPFFFPGKKGLEEVIELFYGNLNTCNYLTYFVIYIAVQNSLKNFSGAVQSLL